MDAKQIHEVIKKLVGPIEPVGESQTDETRYENLKVTAELIDMLTRDLYQVMDSNKNAHEHSRQRVVGYVAATFNELAEWYNQPNGEE